MEAKEIQKIVEEYFNLDPGSTLKRTRKDEIVLARNVIIYFLKIEKWHRKDIMDYFGMEKTTYYNSIEMIEDHAESNRIFQNQFFELKDLVFGESIETETDKETVELLNYTWL
jgi:chromosomal replication initiator protein